MENLKPVKGSNYKFNAVAKDAVDKFKPTFSVNEVDLPAINNWKPGKTYKVLMEIEMTGLTQAPSHIRPQGNVGSFEIKSIAPYQENRAQTIARLKTTYPSKA